MCLIWRLVGVSGLAKTGKGKCTDMKIAGENSIFYGRHFQGFFFSVKPQDTYSPAAYLTTIRNKEQRGSHCSTMHIKCHTNSCLACYLFRIVIRIILYIIIYANIPHRIHTPATHTLLTSVLHLHLSMIKNNKMPVTRRRHVVILKITTFYQSHLLHFCSTNKGISRRFPSQQRIRLEQG